jgi:enamine deaminase RidA (YjgF/YER057c/UK114 family)
LHKAFINPEALPDWKEFFTQIVTVENHGVKTIYISGQVGVDNRQHLVGAGDLAAQTEQAFANLKTALASAGATFADVVKINIYVVRYKYEDAAVISEMICRHFAASPPPACSLIGVQSLAREEFLIEIEATAVSESQADHQPPPRG